MTKSSVVPYANSQQLIDRKNVRGFPSDPFVSTSIFTAVKKIRKRWFFNKFLSNFESFIAYEKAFKNFFHDAALKKKLNLIKSFKQVLSRQEAKLRNLDINKFSQKRFLLKS